MSWTEKALQKHRTKKMIEEVMKTQEYKEMQREMEEQKVADSIAKFAFMMCGFLETRHGYKKEGLKKFLAFFATSLKCTEDDEKFFVTYDSHFKEEYGLDVLGELGLGLEDDAECEK